MAALSIQVPYPVFYDRDGQPLDNGNIYIGVANLDPVTNPLQVYYDEALTITASQPLITSNGYVYRNGTPTQLYVNASDFSITVNDSKNLFVYSFPEATGIGVNATSIEYDPPFTGALTSGYTVAEKLEQYVSVKDFGAVGDGVTNDTAAIQAAFDAFENTGTPFPNRSKIIFFPEGTYLVGSLDVYSGLTLQGEGCKSLLKASGTGIGQILRLSLDSGGFCTEAIVKDIGFYARGSVWAIKAAPGVILSCQFRNLQFDCVYGLNMDGYTQSCIFDTLLSTGPIDQIFRLQGNRNYIKNIVKEGNGGSSSEPYIYFSSHAFGPSDGNILVDLLLEGQGSVNKTPIVFNGFSGTMNGCWIEYVAGTNGYGYDFTNTTIVMDSLCRINKTFGWKVKLTNSTISFLDYDFSSDDFSLQEHIEVDATSSVRFRNVKTRRDDGNYIVPNITKKIFFDSHEAQISVAGQSPFSSLRYTGANLLVNPSFDAGIYGWSVGGAAGGTFDAIDSTFANGKMLRFTNAGNVTKILYQNVTISAGQVGIPLTFTIAVKNVNNDGLTSLFSSGAGVTSSTAIHRSNGSDWQLLTGTVIPTAAGTLQLAILTSGSLVYFDAANGTFGKDSEIDQSSFGSISITNIPIVFATAIPTTGTWPVGSNVKNSAPAVGQPKGWICTVAGTPGTWVSEGNL